MSSVGMASGSIRNQESQTVADKDVVGTPSVPASSLSDSDGDQAARVEGTNASHGDNDERRVGALDEHGGEEREGTVAAQRPDAPRVMGRVKWFNYHKGFGFITVNDQDEEVFVHQSNINSDGFRSLREEEEVEFDLVIGEDGKRKAFNVTGPNGQPPQGAMQGASHHGSQKIPRGMPGMMIDVQKFNMPNMGSMSPMHPSALQAATQGYAPPGNMNVPQINGPPGGQQGQQAYYGHMPPMAFYQQAYYQLNESGYPQPYPMSPTQGHQLRGYGGYGGRGWYGGPRPPPPGTPGISSGLQVVVHNLPWDCSWQVLRAAFEDIGPIERADVVFDSHGRSRGFGVVRFADRESALLAVEKMNDQIISGRVVSVRVDRFA